MVSRKNKLKSEKSANKDCQAARETEKRLQKKKRKKKKKVARGRNLLFQ